MMAIEMLGNARLLWAGRFAAVFAASIAAAGEASIAAAGETMKYSFAGGTSDGAKPYAGLYCCDSSGNFIGATLSGGSLGQGTVFKISPSGVETYLYSLPGSAGSSFGAGPTGTPVLDGSGNILGTAAYDNLNSSGVGSGKGVVYQLTPNGSGGYTYSYLKHFSTSTDGANPFAGLSNPDSSGNYYGTTSAGGSPQAMA